MSWWNSNRMQRALPFRVNYHDEKFHKEKEGGLKNAQNRRRKSYNKHLSAMTYKDKLATLLTTLPQRCTAPTTTFHEIQHLLLELTPLLATIYTGTS
jgi:hypothetical protein